MLKDKERDHLLSYEEVEGDLILLKEVTQPAGHLISKQEQEKDDLLLSFDEQFEKLIRAQRLQGDYITAALRYW